MERWKNKVAIVTGAGQGIGAQIAKDLAKQGMRVIGFEPTEEKTKKMLQNTRLWGKFSGQLIPCKCDISIDGDLEKAFNGIVKAHGGVDLLINNAAIGKEGFICTGDVQAMRDAINVNIYGLIACTRLAIESMKKKGKGHILNINSICGHYMPLFEQPAFNVYIISKRAMSAYSEILRNEIKEANLNITVSSISPGIVKTDLFKNSNIAFINEDFFEKNPHLTVEDVSDAIMIILSTPPNMCIKEMIIHSVHKI